MHKRGQIEWFTTRNIILLLLAVVGLIIIGVLATKGGEVFEKIAKVLRFG